MNMFEEQNQNNMRKNEETRGKCYVSNQLQNMYY